MSYNQPINTCRSLKELCVISNKIGKHYNDAKKGGLTVENNKNISAYSFGKHKNYF